MTAHFAHEATGLPYSLCPKDREVLDVENLALLFYSLALIRKDPVLILNLKKKKLTKAGCSLCLRPCEIITKTSVFYCLGSRL